MSQSRERRGDQYRHRERERENNSVRIEKIRKEKVNRGGDREEKKSDLRATHLKEILRQISCREVILQKQDICLSDVEDKSMAGLNDFPSLKECKCFLGGVDFVTLIFMLLALPLHRMPTAIAACFAVLKPGGLLLFRDYGNFPTKNIKFYLQYYIWNLLKLLRA
ncbi:hypothetical protein ACSBR2_007110 [Camellia fascicularis]